MATAVRGPSRFEPKRLEPHTHIHTHTPSIKKEIEGDHHPPPNHPCLNEKQRERERERKRERERHKYHHPTTPRGRSVAGGALSIMTDMNQSIE